MKTWMLGGTLLLLCGQTVTALSAQVPPTENAIFQCAIKDVHSLSDDGKMGDPNAADLWYSRWMNNFVFDVKSGQKRHSDVIEKWIVLRAGDSGSDLTARIDSLDEIYGILRIRVWKAPITFFMTDVVTSYSGTCARLR